LTVLFPSVATAMSWDTSRFVALRKLGLSLTRPRSSATFVKPLAIACVTAPNLVLTSSHAVTVERAVMVLRSVPSLVTLPMSSARNAMRWAISLATVHKVVEAAVVTAVRRVTELMTVLSLRTCPRSNAATATSSATLVVIAQSRVTTAELNALTATRWATPRFVASNQLPRKLLQLAVASMTIMLAVVVVTSLLLAVAAASETPAETTSVLLLRVVVMKTTGRFVAIADMGLSKAGWWCLIASLISFEGPYHAATIYS